MSDKTTKPEPKRVNMTMKVESVTKGKPRTYIDEDVTTMFETTKPDESFEAKAREYAKGICRNNPSAGFDWPSIANGARWGRDIGLEEGREDDEYADFLTQQMKSLELIAAKRIAELEAENAALRTQVEKLLLRVNKITAYYRHGILTVDQDDVKALNDAQIDFEQALEPQAPKEEE